MVNNFRTLTPEQRAENLIKAKASRDANTAARRTSTLRHDFLDASLWDELARQRGLRLPVWGTACTVSRMRTFIHKAGMTETACKLWLGCSLARFGELNPDWPCRSFAGLVLEQLQEAQHE